MLIDKERIREHLLRQSDFQIVRTDGREYLFLADRMQIFDLEDTNIQEYCRVSRARDRSVDTFLTPSQFATIGSFVASQADSGIQARFTKVPRDMKSTLIMNMAKDCNLACRYCFAYDDKKPIETRMSFARAKEALDFLFASSPPSLQFGITFFGGEPLLNLKVIKQVIDYCQREYSNKKQMRINFSVTTNGTILNDEIVDLLKRHSIGLIISLDGPKHIHDRNRYYQSGRSCHGRVVKNVKRLLKERIKFLLRATLTADCKDVLEIAEYMEEFGTWYGLEFVQKTAHRNSEQAAFSVPALANLRREYRRLMEHFYQLIAGGRKMRCVNVATALKSLHLQTAKDISCCAGLTAMTMNPDGSLYSCQNITNFPEISIGSCRDGIDRPMMEKTAARSVYDMPYCRSCWARLLCGGACLAEKYVDTDTFDHPVKETCAIRRIQWRNYLRLYQRLRNNHPEYLRALEKAKQAC